MGDLSGARNFGRAREWSRKSRQLYTFPKALKNQQYFFFRELTFILFGVGEMGTLEGPEKPRGNNTGKEHAAKSCAEWFASRKFPPLVVTWRARMSQENP